jgi:hypothetical protein
MKLPEQPFNATDIGFLEAASASFSTSSVSPLLDFCLRNFVYCLCPRAADILGMFTDSDIFSFFDMQGEPRLAVAAMKAAFEVNAA